MSTRCPQCRRERPADAAFCAGCGARLSPACPRCGRVAGADDRFCTGCGNPLTRLSVGEPAPTAAALAPRAERELVGERKQLTVLFADVQGSMDLQESLDPETWAAVMDRFVQILEDGVRRFEGTVDTFTGDGIMALFGAPVTHEDHARRACHAALHLANGVGAYAEELRAARGPDLHVRLGLNSGEVVVGRVGDDVRIDPTALGHTVGLARRMEALAEPGRVYLTEHTARLVGDWFDLEDLGPMAVKGSRQPLRVFALGPPSSPSRRSPRTLHTAAMVGRSAELAELEKALAGAADGRTQVVGIVGEAGVGKSRLCDEFAASVAARGIRVVRTSGVSHGRNVPLLPILTLYRDYFGITEGDSHAAARERVATRLLDLDADLVDDLPLVFDFLEIGNPEHAAAPLATELRMRRLFEVLRRATQRRSEQEVLLLVFDDLHWFDRQSARFLERLIDSYPGTRTLLVATLRPEFSAPWMRHTYYRQLPLAPLRDAALGELLGGLLGVDLSLLPLLAFVAERTGGNPFFVEEVIRSLVEDGSLIRDAAGFRLARPLDQVRVPPTVHAVLAARIDRLPPEHKSVLQTAAVIGRTFSLKVLALVSGLSEEALEERLHGLCAAELLQEAAGPPVAEYRFWHALTQEVAYRTLLTGHRRRLHGAVARAIVQLEPEHLDERAAMIASHHDRAAEDLEAARWDFRAAGWQLRTDMPEAVRRWQSVLARLSGIVESDEALVLGVLVRRRLLQFGARLGMSRADAEALFSEGRALAEGLGDIAQLAGLNQFRANFQFWNGDFGPALESFISAARVGDQADDVGLWASLWTGPTLVYPYTGPVGEGLVLADKAIALSGADPDVGVQHLGYSPLTRTLLFRAELLALAGRLEEARRDGSAAVDLARLRSETEFVVWSQAFWGRLAWYCGEEEDALARTADAVRLAVDSGNRGAHVVALVALGTAEVAARRWSDADRVLCEALDQAEAHGAHFEIARIHAYRAQARLQLGDVSAARELGDRAVALSHTQGARIIECLALLTRGEVSRVGGDGDCGAGDLAASLELAEETGAVIYEALILEQLARLRGGRDALEDAARRYRTLGATGRARALGVAPP